MGNLFRGVICAGRVPRFESRVAPNLSLIPSMKSMGDVSTGGMKWRMSKAAMVRLTIYPTPAASLTQSYCGRDIGAGFRFCPYCGRELDD